MATQSSGRWPVVLAVSGAYALQAGLFALAFGAIRAGGDWAEALTAGSTLYLFGGAATLIASGAASLVISQRMATGKHREHFQLPLIMALISGLLCLLIAEVGVRLLAKPDPLGKRIGDTILLPYEWPLLARANREVLARGDPGSAYYVADPRLGWTVGRSRATADGLYLSSSEGLRSREKGVDEAALATDPRIALFGDSFIFSEEVAFPDSLTRHLEDELGGKTRLLNFGVPGYGVDQAALSFEYARTEWAPRVAVLAFIEDDLVRVTNVYPFLKGSWWLPMSKPRYTLQDGQLELLNSPTLGAEDIFNRPSIFDLPFLDDEIEFTAIRWRHHPLHASYLLRLLNGMLPLWPRKGAPVSDDAIVELSTRIIQEFRNSTETAGIAPVIVYFPTSGDLNPRGNRVVKKRVLASLAAHGVAVTDMTGCLSAGIQQTELFMPGGHYTGAGNQAMAGCLAPLIRTALEATGATASAPAEPAP